MLLCLVMFIFGMDNNVRSGWWWLCGGARLKYLKVRQYKICVEYPADIVGNVKVKNENEFDV